MFFSTSLVERRPPFNFVDLYIPSNPFQLAREQRRPGGRALFGGRRGRADQMSSASRRCSTCCETAADAVARVTMRPSCVSRRLASSRSPASAAGTMNVEQLGRLQIYLFMYVAVGLLVSLWVLPGLVAALTPIRMREIFRDDARPADHRVRRRRPVHRPARLDRGQPDPARTPCALTRRQCRRRCRTCSSRHRSTFRTPASCCRSASSCSPAGSPMPRSRCPTIPRLAVTGLLTFFGSLNAAVPFLLDLFRIPADTFQLFLASGVINARVGSLVAAVHTLTVALLGSCAIAGMLRIRRAPLLRYSPITAVLTLGRGRRGPRCLRRVAAARITRKTRCSRHAPAADAGCGRRAEDAARRRGAGCAAGAETHPRARRAARRLHGRRAPVHVLQRARVISSGSTSSSRIGWRRVARRAGVPARRAATTRRTAVGWLLRFRHGGVAVTTLRAGTTAVLGCRTWTRRWRSSCPITRGTPSRRGTSIRADARPSRIAVPNVPYYSDLLTRPAAAGRDPSSGDLGSSFASWDPDVTRFALPAERGLRLDAALPTIHLVVFPNPESSGFPLGVSARQARPGVRDFHEHLDRPQTQRRHAAGALRLLGAGPRRRRRSSRAGPSCGTCSTGSINDKPLLAVRYSLRQPLP